MTETRCLNDGVACREAPATSSVCELTLFQACPLPLLIYDLETRCVRHVNEAACRKYGWSPAEFSRRTLSDFLPDDGRHLDDCGDRTATDVLVTGLWRHRRKDGSVIDVEVAAKEMIFMGRRSRFVCPHDVTEHVLTEAILRERKAALRRAQSMAQLAHNICGPGGLFESWSETLPCLVGLSEQEMPKTARAWLPLVHPDDRMRFRDVMFQTARAGRAGEIDYRLMRADGEEIFIHEVMEPIQEIGGPWRGRWFCTLQDVSAQKRAQAAIELANEKLEARVAERTIDLQMANSELALATAEAERANRYKSEFISNMSHELRTPLNAILGFGQLLAMPGLMERPEAQRSAYIAHIIDGGHHLLKLINEILNLAQIEAGKIEVNVERVALGAVLAECDSMVDPLAARRDIAMRLPMHCDFFVQADRMRLKQVLLNLISNAIKYNREHWQVHVDCEQIGQHVRINVRDTGHGMTPEQTGSLFEAFNRLGRETGSEEGSGIGLVVTKRLVELMGGRLGMSSEPGIGSMFWIELPVAAICPARVALDFEGDGAHRSGGGGVDDQVQTRCAGVAAQEVTILIVDDDVASLRLVEEAVMTLPHVRLLTASNGRLAVEMAQAHVPSVIVMDNNMPEMSGREAQERLRVDPRTAGIPVVGVSANAMPGEASAGLAAGFFRYLTKPVDVRALLQAVEAALVESQCSPMQGSIADSLFFEGQGVHKVTCVL